MLKRLLLYWIKLKHISKTKKRVHRITYAELHAVQGISKDVVRSAFRGIHSDSRVCTKVLQVSLSSEQLRLNGEALFTPNPWTQHACRLEILVAPKNLSLEGCVLRHLNLFDEY